MTTTNRPTPADQRDVCPNCDRPDLYWLGVNDGGWIFQCIHCGNMEVRSDQDMNPATERTRKVTATFTYQHPFKGDLYPVTREATQYDPRSDHDWLCELVAYHTGEAWWVENTDTDRVVFTDIGRGRFLRIQANPAGDVTMRCYNKDGFQVAAITWHADERDQLEAMLTWLTN